MNYTSNSGIEVTETPEVIDLLNIIKSNLENLTAHRHSLSNAIHRISDTRTPQKEAGSNNPQKEPVTVVEKLHSILAQLQSENEHLYESLQRLNKLV